MKRLVPFVLKGSLLLILLVSQGCALLMIRSIEVMKERNDIKERVDVSCTTQVGVRDVWTAALASVDSLGLSVQSKDFDGREGTIMAATPAVAYIRIHVAEDDKRITTIGVQARKKKIPSNYGDYDFDLGDKIINRIRKNLEPIQGPGS